MKHISVDLLEIVIVYLVILIVFLALVILIVVLLVILIVVLLVILIVVLLVILIFFLESSFFFRPYFCGKETETDGLQMNPAEFGMNRIGFGMDLLGFEMYSEDFGCVLIVYLESSFSLGPYHCKKEAVGLQMDQADFGMNPIGFEIDLAL